MGMDLLGTGGDFRLNNISWRYVLALVRQHGWEPAGTELPQLTLYNRDDTVDEGATRRVYQEAAEDWDGGYSSNDGQWVTDEDARNMAEALEQALPHIPDEETVGLRAASTEIRDGRKVRAGGIDLEMLEYLTAIDWFSGAGKQSLRDFISYCRAGGFTIW